jgi:hypothetical protein
MSGTISQSGGQVRIEARERVGDAAPLSTGAEAGSRPMNDVHTRDPTTPSFLGHLPAIPVVPAFIFTSPLNQERSAQRRRPGGAGEHARHDAAGLDRGTKARRATSRRSGTNSPSPASVTPAHTTTDLGVQHVHQVRDAVPRYFAVSLTTWSATTSPWFAAS